MNNVEELYQKGQILLRAMDQPIIKIRNNNKYYECNTWIDEFVYAMTEGLFSLSTTLVVPGVGVKNYKNIGFIVDSSKAQCFHIAKTDSGSCGSIRNNDFHANKPDFDTIEELANYIRTNNATVMNEVNINVKLDGIIGLFINDCGISYKLLQKIYVVKTMLKHLTGIDYPIYKYDWNNGKLDRIDLTYDMEETIINDLEANQIFFWPDNIEEPYFINIESSQKQM